MAPMFFGLPCLVKGMLQQQLVNHQQFLHLGLPRQFSESIPVESDISDNQKIGFSIWKWILHQQPKVPSGKHGNSLTIAKG
jgi:hypothetical protein